MAFSAINKGSSFQNQVLYTGNAGTQSITNLGFQPDLTWIKSRSASTYHSLSDAVNGTDLQLGTNDSNAGDNFTTAITAFDSDGFSLGSNGNTNTGSRTFVGWNWKAGTTSGIATNGSTTITPSAYSFNQTTGISIIKYTGNSTVGAKIPHGLGVAPKMIIVKSTTNAYEWAVYHASLGATKWVELQSAAAASTGSIVWNDTAPDSVNFTVASNNRTNGSSTYVAYCFAEVSGFSKFGSYIGNGNVDGTFVYTGFKPSFLLIKTTGAEDSWRLWDNARNTYNVMDITLRPNTADGDYVAAANNIDFLSNGFKLRTTSGGYNGSTDTLIYMAFGQPIISNSGTPATAR